MMMKRVPLALMAALVCAAAAFLVGRHQASRWKVELATQQAAWAAEKAELERALQNGRAHRMATPPEMISSPTPPAVVPPENLLTMLGALSIPPAPAQVGPLRQSIAWLQQLRDAGPAALPAVEAFLLSNRDVAYPAPALKGTRDVRSLAEGVIPASLRFALFDLVRQMGGEEGERILADNVSRAGRGLELAYLTEVLEEMAPGKYQGLALASARSLLTQTAGAEGADREFLFGILRRFGDASFVATAEAQLLRANGQLDRSALRYLQETLGQQSVAIAAQSYEDGRFSEPAAKEGLARLALAFVGGNDQAVQLWHRAIVDPSLTPDQKRNLIEDLNEDGLRNKKVPTAEDLELISRRYALTQAYLQEQYVLQDKMLNAAFREADKDLRNLLQKAAAAQTVGDPGTKLR